MEQPIERLESRRLLAESGGVGAQFQIDRARVQVDRGAFGANSFQVDRATVQLDNASSGYQMHVTKRGTLVIKGTDAADTLAVVREGNTVKMYTSVQHPRDTMVLTDGSIRRVLVEAGGGDDVIDVAGFDRPATVAGGAGDDSLWCGRGQQLIGGGGDDVLVATAAWNLPEVGSDDMVGDPVDPRPSLLSGGAGKDVLVAAPGLADSLIGGTGVDQLICTAEFPEGEAPSGIEAAELLIAQDGVTLSGLEIIDMRLRRASVETPDGPTFNSPFGLVGHRSFAFRGST